MAKKKIERGCDCIDQVDQQLRNQNTMLDLAHVFDMDAGMIVTYPKIATMKRDSSVRGRKAAMVGSYCPFCGRKYEERDETTQKKLPNGRRSKSAPRTVGKLS